MRKIFLKAQAGFLYKRSLLFADIAEMPWLIGKAGNGFLILWITQDKAVFGGVLKKPRFAVAALKFAVFRKNIHRKTAVVLACSGGGGCCAGVKKLLLAVIGALCG